MIVIVYLSQHKHQYHLFYRTKRHKNLIKIKGPDTYEAYYLLVLTSKSKCILPLHLEDRDGHFLFAHVILFKARKLVMLSLQCLFYRNYTTKQLCFPLFSIFYFDLCHAFWLTFPYCRFDGLVRHDPLELLLSHFHNLLLCLSH